MAETKEKQYAVLRYTRANVGRVWEVPSSIVWFDSRSEARAYRTKRNTRGSKSYYAIKQMTRGPRS